MTNKMLRHRAHKCDLLDSDMMTAIKAGEPLPLEQVVLSLVDGALDCYWVVYRDSESTWNDKRLVRSNLINCVPTALAITKSDDDNPLSDAIL